jgi:hypothetical protein
MWFSNYKLEETSQLFTKSSSLFLRIVIFLLLLFSMFSALYSAHAQMEPRISSMLDDNVFVKTIASPISSNSTNKYTPFTTNLTLPPRILMVYNGIQHPGVLVSYKYRHGYTFGQLDIPAEKVTALLPSDVVNIKKGSFVRFFAKGDPTILPPSSLSIDAYTSQGKAVSVLNATKSESTTFALNLNEGKYILLAVATWIPRSEDVTGYTVFTYMINVVP